MTLDCKDVRIINSYKFVTKKFVHLKNIFFAVYTFYINTYTFK